MIATNARINITPMSILSPFIIIKFYFRIIFLFSVGPDECG
jgi:hypothetical protein